MTEFEIAVSGEQAVLVASRGQLTYRMAGAKLRFSFDGEWNALTPHALVRQGDAAVAIPMEGSTAVIPGHALTAVGDFVYAGVYGVSADGAVAIPTVWVRLGRLRDGAHIFYDADVLPNTPIWQTLGEQIGDIARLQTPEKTNLVDAVNSISAGSLGAIPAPQTAEIGQAAVVKAVDDAGKPTQWEAASLGEAWRQVARVTLAEPVASVTISQDAQGKPLRLKKAYCRLKPYPADGAAAKLYLRLDPEELTANHVEVVSGVREAACTVISIELFGKMARSLAATVQYGGAVAATMNAENKHGIDREWMDVLQFVSSGSGFAAGSEFEIWGCDA